MILSGLFDNGVVNPRFCKAAEIDPIKNMADRVFNKFSAVVFCFVAYSPGTGSWDLLGNSLIFGRLGICGEFAGNFPFSFPVPREDSTIK